MAVKRRTANPFSLAFLDVMSCGFGAAVLLFLVIKHAAPVPQVLRGDAEGTLGEPITETAETDGSRTDLTPPVDADVAPDIATTLTPQASTASQITEALAELERLEMRSQDLREAITSVDKLIAKNLVAVTQARQIIDEREAEGDDAAGATTGQALSELQQALAEKRANYVALRDSLAVSGTAVRHLPGDGERDYISGLKLTGRRQLILLDSSASMLDSSLVNILRTRNLAPEVRKRSRKWRRALSVVNWLSAKLPAESQFAVAHFSESVTPLGAAGKVWLGASDTPAQTELLQALSEIDPNGGTSLAAAFAFIAELKPRPQTVHLITDGLPTLAADASARAGGRVSGRRRLALFADALEQLPPGVAVNIILLPLEGDPEAPAAYWRLAQRTGGTLLTPAPDWPNLQEITVNAATGNGATAPDAVTPTVAAPAAASDATSM
mgnify:FL=1